MAAVVGSLRADLETNVAQFKTDMGQAADSVDKTSRSMKKAETSAGQAGKAFGELGRSLKSALAFGGAAALALFVTNAVKGAIETEEMSGVIKREFGAMGDSVEAWAEQTGRSLGRVDDELKASVVSFGQLFEKVVPTQGAAADMSEEFTKLAVDLATFNRIPISEATDKLKAGLAGSTKGLKEFGVLITKQEIDQRALKMGLAASTKELSSQDRVLASYNLILEKTASVHGFAASQADTAAGRMKAFEAQVDSLSDDLGAILVPVLMEVVKWLDLYAQGLKTILGDTNDFQLGIQVLGARMTGGNVKKVVEEFRKAHNIIDETARAAATNGGIIEEEFEGGAETASHLRKELRGVSDAAADATRSVRDFGIPDQAANAKVIDDLGDKFNEMSRTLRNQLEDLKELDNGTGRYADQIEILKESLGRLADKYGTASEAAIKLFEAQERLNDARLASQLGQMQQGADALVAAGGGAGVLSQNQERLQSLERELSHDRLEGVARLRDMEAERAAAELANDGASVARIGQLIEAQTRYNELVDTTTAKQIFAQEKLQEMVGVWFDTVSSTFADLFKGLRDSGDEFNFKEWGANFIRNLSDSVLERKSEQLTETLFGWLGLTGKTQQVDTIQARTLSIMSGGLSGGNAFGGTGGGFGGQAQGGASGGQGGDIWGNLINWGVNAFAGMFAGGGTLNPGEWGIAGENGPELLRGGRHGMDIEPMTGGGGAPTQVFNITTPNPDGFRQSRRQIAQMARRQLA